MFQKMVTKNGEVLWLKTEGEILGAKEIKRINWQRWELRDELRKAEERDSE